jgi:hypothetical protein
MTDGLHIPIQNRIMKPLGIALSGVRGDWGGDYGGNLINVQCEALQNCHNESLLYSKYIL